MKLELYLQNSNSGTVYDISNIATDIQVTQTLDGEAGKLTATLKKDPNNLLQIANGSIISFIVDNKGFFFGYVFKISTDDSGDYKITCYDQLRYMKYSDVLATSGLTASDIFAKICQDYGLRYQIKVPTSYVPEAYLHDNKTLYAIVKRGKDLASLNDNAQYFIRDDFGTLVWSELSYEKTNVQLGEGSALTGYDYEKSIDGDTYNQIKLYRDETTKQTTSKGSTKTVKTGKRQVWLVKDSDNIKRWGTLQFLKKVDDNLNSAQVRQLAENYIKAKNKETETLKLEALGIPELRVGRGIKFVLPKENIDKWMWITSCIHKFTKYEHKMTLEVEV